jgi:ketosteroid isomerase-like protein
MEADRAFDKETAAKGVEGWVSFFAGNGRMHGGGEIIQGHDAVRKAMAPLFAQPGNSLRWYPVTAEAARSGDLGYTTGESVRRVRAPDGKLMESHGRYVTIWRRQKDRSWKVELDIGSSGPPKPVEGQ